MYAKLEVSVCVCVLITMLYKMLGRPEHNWDAIATEEDEAEKLVTPLQLFNI